MNNIDTQVQPVGEAIDGPCALESKLRHLYAEQWRLMVELDRMRTELDQINAEVLKTQDEYCTSPEREEEYEQCMQRITGVDGRKELKEIEEALRHPPPPFEELIKILEQVAEQADSPEVP